jgi:citronellol/citronellal dehydrogenase
MTAPGRSQYQSVFRPGLFEGKIAIVTGGGSGIGRCIAHELAALGATTILASRDRSKLEKVAEEIRSDGGRADVIPCVIRVEDQVKALVADALERHGRLDFVVNNGGGQFVSPLENLSLRGWQAVIDTNLTGTFLVSREAVVQRMREHGGAIVNIVADMWRGMPMMGHSGAARAGVVNLTKTCALEWSQYGIRVNAIAPGMILSSGFKTYPEPVQELLKTLPKEVPAGRFGTESEVSAAVAFLLSPAAAYLTGETLRVDGAQSLYRHPMQLASGAPFRSFNGFHRRADAPAGLETGEDIFGAP